MKATVTNSLVHNDKTYEPGDTFEGSQDLVRELIEVGALEDPNARPAASPAATEDAEAKAAKIVEDAKAKAAQIVDGAKEVAEQIKEDAKAKAVELTDAAKEKAAEIVSKAKEQAETKGDK